MVKKNCLFLLFILTFSSIRASEDLTTVPPPFTQEYCDAPAPDSFEIASRGANFVTLSWIPAWNNASHTLYVLSKSDSSNWTLINSFFNVIGSTITIENVASNIECKFIISTNCPSGEKSVISAEITDKVILDLILGGRTPIDPKPVICSYIQTNSHPWIGFGISEGIGSQTYYKYLFELIYVSRLGESHVDIKRVITDSPVVATDGNGNWPTDQDPILKSPNPFTIGKILDNNQLFEIGDLFLTIHAMNFIDLCIASSNPPWSNFYNYTFLVADKISNGLVDNFANDRMSQIKLNKKENVFYTQNPVLEAIDLYRNDSPTLQNHVNIKLLRMNGDLIFEVKNIMVLDHVSIPVSNIQNGIYILQIQSEENVSALKIIKQ